MANTDKIVVGLDIGTTKVTAIVGKLGEHGKVNVLGLGRADSEGVRRGVIDNIDKTVAAIRKAVEEAEKHANVEIYVVHAGIAGEHLRSTKQKGIITLHSHNQEIAQADVTRLRDDMYKVAVPPGTEVLHVMPQDYTVDNQSGIKDPVGHMGVRLEGNFHIVTCDSTSANNIYRCVRRAGLEVEELIMQPLAAVHAVLGDDEMEEGVCLVDIGGGTTDVVIYEDGIIRHSAVIPFGGDIITQDIRQGLMLHRKQAEYLKTNAGSAFPQALPDDEIITIAGQNGRPPREIRRRMLAGIIQARMEEIIELVALEIRNAGYSKLVGGIVLTGGGAQLQHIDHLVAYVTGMDARVGYPGDKLAKGMVEEVNHPSYASAAGLLVYGLRDVLQPQQENKAGALHQNGNGNGKAKVEEKPANDPSKSFIQKVKNWFEASITNAGNIE